LHIELRVAMIRAGHTYGSLAQALGVTNTWICYVLTGRWPGRKLRLRIAAALNVDPIWLDRHIPVHHSKLQTPNSKLRTAHDAA